MGYLLYSQDYTILFGELLCSIIQHFSKIITTGWYPSIFKRPNGATDCNLFNLGGKSDHCSGFPSGHVASITILMEMLLLRNDTTGLYNKITYYVPIVLMGYSRYMKKCHNIIQIFAGYVLGYSVANLLYKYDDDIITNTNSTSSNDCLTKHALKYAKESRFSTDATKQTQIGTITFNFIGKR